MTEQMDVDGPMDLSVRKDCGSSKSNLPEIAVICESPKPEVHPTDETVVARPLAALASSPAAPGPKAQKPVSVVSPHVADHPAAALDSPPPSAGRTQPFAPSLFNPFLSTTARPSLTPPPNRSDPPLMSTPSLLSAQQQLDLEFQQRQLDLAFHQQLLEHHQLELQQKRHQQMWFQQHIQNHRQLQMYASLGDQGTLEYYQSAWEDYQAVHSLSYPYDSYMPPSPASSAASEFSAFPFAGIYGKSHTATVDEMAYKNKTYPYLNRAFSGGRTDGPMTPESTTVDNQHDDESTGTPGAGRGPDVRDEDVADIYRTAEFLSFRQRYIDSLGPPRNYEKMRRSVPSDRRTGLSLAYDPSYLQKRMKNNEAAKKSRDAKRQNFIENQICVMYLTKKIRDLNEMKRRLVLSR